MSIQTPTPMFSLQDIPFKGKGLVATTLIPQGTRILCETPILTQDAYGTDTPALRACIEQQVAALPTHQRDAVRSLLNIHPAKGAFGILQTNALPAKDDTSAIFLIACRINHACDNNAQTSYNEKSGKNTVHALRDIQKGEEITIFYMTRHRGFEARQKALKKSFGFECRCDLCSLTGEDRRKSDARLEKIEKLDGLIEHGAMGGIVDEPLRFLRMVERQVELYMEQSPTTFDCGLPRAWLDAAQICIANGDLARGSVFASRAVEGWKLCRGDDCGILSEHNTLVEKPESFALYGLSEKWTLGIDEVPGDLNKVDFEKWLWKRENSLSQSGKVNSKFLSSFDELPGRSEAKGHWCLLGSITDTTGGLVRLKLSIRDIHGNVFPMWFYTPSRGEELDSSLVKEGNSIAVLYPHRHAFQYDEPGIRLEDPSVFKIFPLPIKNFLGLISKFQKFGVESADKLRICHGCEKKTLGSPLNRCANCNCFWYCNQKCQIVGWKEKGHKDVCKLLKNDQLKAFLTVDWASFEERLSFPLPIAR